MSKTPLDRLSEAYGLQLSYLTTGKERRAPSDAAKRAVLQAMSVAAEDDEQIARSLLATPAPIDGTIAAPTGACCFMPEWLDTGRAWGVTCQLYGLRSARNHGIGDFEDLACLAERVAADGGDFLGVNPVHALFTAEPDRCSPFSPSNRSFLNPLYIAIDRIPGITGPTQRDDTAHARLRASTQIDYGAVAAFKLGTLRALWRQLQKEPRRWIPESRLAFERFVETGDAPLRDHALFEALSHHMVDRGQGAGWPGWPEAYRSPENPAVQRFAQEHEDEVRFHLWLQWVADAQLRTAAERARAAGMRIGLYLDFAVGAAPDGSATWSDPELVVPGANIGAPPDSFFADGQDWGLAPLSPAVLRARRLAPYRRVLERATRHAGAIRIDHAMSLHRLFWIPHGMTANEGCYVLYPLADMLRTLAEVSLAQQTIVIGEDLGTVPKGFGALMQRINMLSCRVLYFERTQAGFRAVASYGRNVFISASTHDLPPLAAWWTGADISLLCALGLLDTDSAEPRRKDRERDRRILTARLCKDLPRRALPPSFPTDDDVRGRELTQNLAVAIHAFLARTPSRLLGVQFEDLCGAETPVNIPGTLDEYPNWRLRAPATIEEAAGSGLWTAILKAVARERPRPG